MARILLIEDDADLLFLYRTALAQHGHETLDAESVSHAFTWLGVHSFDAIILDLNLPDAHGSVVAQHVIEQNLMSATQIIVITANDRGLDNLEALGIQHILIKPISVGTVTDLVNQVTQ